jgi:hypothetical protein
MKEILKRGKVKRLFSEDKSGGWSKETYLLRYKDKKYVVRKCSTLERAKFYEEIENKLGKYDILPKIIERCGKNVFYEYIDGRDLTYKESKKIIEQIGKIASYINKIKVSGKIDKRFNKQLNEIITGRFSDIKKKVKSILTKEDIEIIKKIYSYLRKKSEPKLVWDLNDLNPDNFRLRNGKVYFVDVEAIQPRIKLFCMGKGFMRWFKTKGEQKASKKGYKSVSSIKFLTKHYEEFIYLNFLIQEVNYKTKYREKYSPRTKIRTDKLYLLIKKYESKVK